MIPARMSRVFFRYPAIVSAFILMPIPAVFRGTPVIGHPIQDQDLEFMFVPGGSFQMGDLWGDGYSEDEKPVHWVDVSAFWIAKTEVTNLQYCDFLNEKGNKIEEGVPWLDLTDENCLIEKKGGKYVPQKGYENHPVVEVTWFGARAYADWIGARLPTEAEWEFAACSGGKPLKFPYGAWITRNQANFVGTGGRDRWKQTSPVAHFDPTALGIFDISGNVWEMCQDWYGNTYYQNTPRENPAGPETGTHRVIRGGSWNYPRHICRVSLRGMHDPLESAEDIGFRVVRDVTDLESFHP
jgi:formylglycine-generating enzyme required for sulfatase activity